MRVKNLITKKTSIEAERIERKMYAKPYIEKEERKKKEKERKKGLHTMLFHRYHIVTTACYHIVT